MEPQELYVKGAAASAKAPILVTHFEGALDAGSAGGLATYQLLRSLPSQRVVTFNPDELIDYRSHRPVAEVRDWVTAKVSVPEIAIDLLHDDAGTPVFLLHGPEPDGRWEAFTQAVMDLVEEAGVEVMFSLHGLPAAVPHSRPTSVHIQSTDADLLPEQPHMGGIARFPAPFTSFLQYRLSRRGIPGMALLATVPYYMSETSFPKASSALLRRLSSIAELSLPIGDLERGAGQDENQVEKLLSHNAELRGTVKALEAHYDSISGAAAEGARLDQDQEGEDETQSLPSWEVMMEAEATGAFPDAERVNEDSESSIADFIGSAVEKYLRTQAKRKTRSGRHLESQVEESLQQDDQTAEAARGETAKYQPRHRAPKPLEGQTWNKPGEENEEE